MATKFNFVEGDSPLKEQFDAKSGSLDKMEESEFDGDFVFKPKRKNADPIKFSEDGSIDFGPKPSERMSLEEAFPFFNDESKKSSDSEKVPEKQHKKGGSKMSDEVKVLTGGIRGGHPVANEEEFLFSHEGVGVGYTFFRYDSNHNLVRWVSNDLEFAQREAVCSIYEEVPIYWKDGKYLRRANPEEEKLYWEIRNKL